MTSKYCDIPGIQELINKIANLKQSNDHASSGKMTDEEVNKFINILITNFHDSIEQTDERKDEVVPFTIYVMQKAEEKYFLNTTVMPTPIAEHSNLIMEQRPNYTINILPSQQNHRMQQVHASNGNYIGQRSDYGMNFSPNSPNHMILPSNANNTNAMQKSPEYGINCLPNSRAPINNLPNSQASIMPNPVADKINLIIQHMKFLVNSQNRTMMDQSVANDRNLIQQHLDCGVHFSRNLQIPNPVAENRNGTEQLPTYGMNYLPNSQSNVTPHSPLNNTNGMEQRPDYGMNYIPNSQNQVLRQPDANDRNLLEQHSSYGMNCLPNSLILFVPQPDANSRNFMEQHSNYGMNLFLKSQNPVMPQPIDNNRNFMEQRPSYGVNFLSNSHNPAMPQQAANHSNLMEQHTTHSKNDLPYLNLQNSVMPQQVANNSVEQSPIYGMNFLPNSQNPVIPQPVANNMNSMEQHPTTGLNHLPNSQNSVIANNKDSMEQRPTYGMNFLPNPQNTVNPILIANNKNFKEQTPNYGMNLSKNSQKCVNRSHCKDNMIPDLSPAFCVPNIFMQTNKNYFINASNGNNDKRKSIGGSVSQSPLSKRRVRKSDSFESHSFASFTKSHCRENKSSYHDGGGHLDSHHDVSFCSKKIPIDKEDLASSNDTAGQDTVLSASSEFADIRKDSISHSSYETHASTSNNIAETSILSSSQPAIITPTPVKPIRDVALLSNAVKGESVLELVIERNKDDLHNPSCVSDTKELEDLFHVDKIFLEPPDEI